MEPTNKVARRRNSEVVTSLELYELLHDIFALHRLPGAVAIERTTLPPALRAITDRWQRSNLEDEPLAFRFTADAPAFFLIQNAIVDRYCVKAAYADGRDVPDALLPRELRLLRSSGMGAPPDPRSVLVGLLRGDLFDADGLSKDGRVKVSRTGDYYADAIAYIDNVVDGARTWTLTPTRADFPQLMRPLVTRTRDVAKKLGVVLAVTNVCFDAFGGKA